MNLKNAVALVTGGSVGIGYSIAKTLVESGARVAITGRDKARLEQAAKELGAHPIQADVAKEADVLRTYQEVLNSDSEYYFGSNVGNGLGLPAQEQKWQSQPYSIEMTLPPLALVVLKPER